MERKRHEILVTASDKDFTFRLLDCYGFKYVKLNSYGKSILRKAINIIPLDMQLLNRVKRFNADLFLGLGSIRASHVAYFMKRASIIFEDTEHSGEQHLLYLPFTNVVLTPSCFKKDLGKKHVRYNGYKELAYLYPKYFKPDSSVLDKLCLSKNERFIVIRFVSWAATHDIGQSGIENRIDLVRNLEKYGKVLITSEGKLEKDLEKNRITLSPEKFHDLLWYATLYFGEGSTIASESAILGTPSIYVSSLEGRLGYLEELEQKYDLMYSFASSDDALKKAIELLQMPNIKHDWRMKREIMLRDKIDVTEFMVRFIENYLYCITHNE